MSHTIERRHVRTEFRDVPGSNGRQKWATAVRYNVADDYGTLWLPGCFDAALSERMPVFLFGHSWDDLENVLGCGIDFRQTPPDVGPPGVDVLVEFADIDAGRTAMALTAPNATSKGPVLTDVSVGFCREEWLSRDQLTPDQLALGAMEAMVEAGMDELSLVVRGAVPGAMLRTRGRRSIDLDQIVEIARRKAAGELSDEEAAAAVRLLGDIGAAVEPAAPAPVAPVVEPPEPPVEPLVSDAEVVAALDAAYGRSRI